MVKSVLYLPFFLYFLFLGMGAAETSVMPLEEVAKGMRGKGRSVFRGTKVEQFDVEILGVLRDVMPRGSVILARVDTPNLRQGGVISGMSGSPVYVQGRLLGAVSFGWRFAKEGLCGLTPIEDMLGMLTPTKSDGAVAEANWETMLPARTTEDLSMLLLPQKVREQLRRHELFSLVSEGANLRPILTPVMVSCWDDTLMAKLHPWLARCGMVPVQAGTVSDTTASVRDLRPGAAVGVQLIGGDMSAVAIGTVTYRDGNRILAFGHPFVNAGDVAMPMTSAYVHAIMPSQDFSFKLAGATGVIGTVEFDRRYAVGGRLGVACRTVPCEVSVRSATTRKTHTYKYELASHRELTPLLAGWAVAASYARTERVVGQTMADLRFETWIAGRDKPFVLENCFFDDGHLTQLLLQYGELLHFITRNPFAPLQIERVRVVLDLEHGRRTAVIQEMQLSTRLVVPGQSVTVTVRLMPYETGEVVEKRVTLNIPPTVPGGLRMPVVVCDAPTSLRLRMESAPGAYRPRTLEEILRWIEELPRNTDVFVHVPVPEQGVTFRGTRLPDLPGSLLTVLGEPNETGAEPMRGALVERLHSDWVVMGATALTIFTTKE